jgi:hypothetical protein
MLFSYTYYCTVDWLNKYELYQNNFILYVFILYSISYINLPVISTIMIDQCPQREVMLICMLVIDANTQALYCI